MNPTLSTPDAAPAAPASRPRMGVHGLDAIFRPQSVAVIGASRDRDTIGGRLFHNLLSSSFRGPVYPVNPKANVIQSVRAYRSIEEIPDPVDLAIIVVPALHVLSAVDACGRKGVRGVVVISAGFKETGAEGAAREQELLDCVRRHDIRMVGPNCLGVINTEPDVRLDSTFAQIHPPAGRVAFSSQSGALGVAILDLAIQLNIGISHFISVGNKADVSGNDLLEYWEKDEGTNVILLYLESFGNPRRFTQIARRVARRKPIVAVKSGRTAAGVRAASSHTGSLAGPDTAVTALCEQSGVIRTDTIEELFDVAMLLANQPVPRRNRVGIVTNAGGPGIMASDACETHGLVVPALEPGTVEALRAFLPTEASTRNPVDMVASATPEAFERAVRLVLEDPNVDALLTIYVTPIVTGPAEVAQAILRGARAAARTAGERGVPAKPLLTCFMGSHGVPEGLRSLHEGHVPSYTFPEPAAIALSRAVRYGRWLAEPEGRTLHFRDVERDRAGAALAAARGRAAPGQSAWLSPDEVREVLEAYGFTMPAGVVVHDADAAVAAAAGMGYPVAIKLVSETISHKSDVGGVILDVRSEAEVREAVRGIERRLREQGRSAELTGIAVQRMIREGIEAIVGVTQDPTFGPLVMFGLGGVHVELLRDVAFRIHPLTDRDARELVRGVRGGKLLEGYRGAPPGDVPALEEVLLRVSQLLEDHPDIAEMDLNPVKVLSPGRGCVTVDARIAVRGE
jgi:acetyl coenzyme A synthetase (ADP forming)-like protein